VLRGARNVRTLSAAFIADLQEDWEKYGTAFKWRASLNFHIREQPGSGNTALDKNKNAARRGRYEAVAAKGGEGRFGFIISR
jgi:hypothetical protein